MALVLPSIRVGLLNVTWTNGSRAKPLNPITADLISDFEEKPNLKINWFSEFTGTIKLKGVYNYLIYNNHEPYYLEISGVVDLDKSIFVYTVTKDVWQSFIMNGNNSFKGCLIKTDNDKVLWKNIQQTLGAVGSVNNEIVFNVCKNSKCDDVSPIKDLITYFNKNKANQIDFFGWKYRISKTGFDKFKNLINAKKNQSFTNKPNQIFGFCPFYKKSNWENYIAGLVEGFLRYNSDIIIGKASDLSSLNMNGLKQKLISNGFNNAFYCLTRESANNIGSFKAESKILNKFDLNQITEITYLNGENMEILEAFNKDVTTMEETPINLFSEDVYTLKNKLYHPTPNEHRHFSFLNIPQKTFHAKYQLNEKYLTEINLQSLEPSINVDAYYYGSWMDSLTAENAFKIRGFDSSTELGFLLYKISNFSFRTYSENHFTYNGTDIFLTVGVKLSNFKMPCSYVYDKTTSQQQTGKKLNVLFGDVYKTDIEKNLWETIWSVYLWQGQIGRVFEGLTQDGLITSFKYTVPKCFAENDDVYTYEKYASENSELNKDKTPTYLTGTTTLTEEQNFKKALKTLDARRRRVEIYQRIDLPIEAGDLFWNSLTHGLFNGSDEELKISGPCLVVWSDVKYTFEKNKVNTTTLNNSNSWGWKLGTIEKHEGLEIAKVENNLISDGGELPEIHYLKPLLKVLPNLNYKREEAFLKLKNFFRPNQKPFGNEKIYIYSPWWERFNWNGFDWTPTDTKHTWLKEGNQKALIVGGGNKDVGVWQYIAWHLSNGHTFYTYNSKASRYTVRTAAKETIDRLNFVQGADATTVTYTSWNDLTTLHTQLNQNIIKGVITKCYQRLNKEKLHNDKFTHIDEAFLKAQPNKIHLFGLGSQGKNLLYLLLKWPSGAQKPVINIIIGDQNLLSDEPATNIKVVNTPLLVNKNLVQVVNQQNVLYVQGKTYPIKTKFVTDTGFVDYVWRCDQIPVEKDLQQSHYKLIFSGDGGDYIRDTISIINKEILNTIGATNQVDLLNLNLQIEENRKNREIALKGMKERERIEGINTRNAQLDIEWEQSNSGWEKGLTILNTATKAVSQMGQAFMGGNIIGGIGAVAGAVGSGINIYKAFQEQDRNLLNKQRDLDETNLRNSNAIELDKNRLDNSHKYEELREKRRIHEISNIHISSTPNNADILSSLHDMENIKNGFCVFHRYPIGTLLDYLTEYHKNWGFDIVLNEYETSINLLRQDNGKIYQFSRIDEISLTNIREQEIIKSTLVNGVLLVKHTYKLQHSSYLEQRRKHKEKIAAALRAVEVEKAKKRQMELDEIAAISKGTELAKTDYSEINKKLEAKEAELKEALKEVNQFKSTLQEKEKTITSQIALYNELQTRATTIAQQITAKKDAEIKKITDDCEEAKTAETEKNRVLIQTLEATLSDYQNSVVLNQTIEAKNQLEREKNNWTQERTHLIGTLTNSAQKIRDLTTKNARLDVETGTLKIEKLQCDAEKASVETQLNTLKLERANIQTELNGLKVEKIKIENEKDNLKTTLDELTKKKTKLGLLRGIYQNIFDCIKAIMNTSVINNYEGCNTTYTTNQATLNYIDAITLVERDDDTEILCGPFFDAYSAEEVPPLLPQFDCRYHDKVLSQTYKGFRIAKDSEYIGFLLHKTVNRASYNQMLENGSMMPKTVTGYTSILSELRKFGRALVTYSNEIRNLNKEIASFIRQNKTYIPEAETRAEEWDFLNY